MSETALGFVVRMRDFGNNVEVINPGAWDVCNLGATTGPAFVVLPMLRKLLDEDARLNRVEWTKEFLSLRLRCAEVL